MQFEQLEEKYIREKFSGVILGMQAEYNLYETLGSGSYGEVRVSKLASGQLVAIKIFYYDNPNFNKTSIETARTELLSATKFRHPNLLQYYDFSEAAILR
jgi:serine/threonine protein kinase